MNDWPPQKLRDFFANFNPKNPNHLAAVDLLQSHVPGVMNDGAEWVQKFRQKPAAVSSGDRVPQQALNLIKKYEGFRSGPYICPAGVPTIGYGNTYYPRTGAKVKMTDAPVSPDAAELLLKECVEKDFVPKLEKIPYWGEMSDGQRSALISFAYNLGANFYGDMDNFGSITRDLRDKNWANVPTTLLKYRNPGSSFEEGLRKRRTEEGEVWES
jgi:GH24 family phage-related lysozyme (muramidase)